jgi:hypothetical protein
MGITIDSHSNQMQIEKEESSNKHLDETSGAAEQRGSSTWVVGQS